MSTKWVTPLFLSVLSFMINTQNVCAMSKQGQEQRYSDTFQTNLKTTNHQTVSSSRNETNLQTSSQGPIDSLEDLLSNWDSVLIEVKRQIKASDEDFTLFSNFNRSYLDSEWSALFQLIKFRKVNYSNIASYLSPKKQKLQALYLTFVQIKEQYPGSVEPFRHPSVVPPLPIGCNPACTNMDFSAGNLTGWTGFYAMNNSTTLAHVITGITGGTLGPVVRGARDPATSNSYQVHITSRGNNDWFLSTYHSINMSQASPWGTGYSAMIGDSINNGKGVAVLSQEFQVTPTTNSVTYAYSVFLENPAHNYYQQPFFSVVLFDQNGDTIRNCGVYTVVSNSNIPGFVGEYYPPDNRETVGNAGGDTIYWKPWTQVNVPLNNYVGQCVTVQFEVGDCALGGHCGYAYVDASCSTFTITAASPVICGNGTDVLTGPAGESRYYWTGPSNSILTNDTLQSITVDSAGTYTLVITPVTGGLCKDTLTISIGKDLIAATATATNINCNGGTGTATVTTVNGTSPYTYVWLPSGATNATATGLSAGIYTVTVTDSNGCRATATTTITQPTALIASTTTLTNVNCNGNANGSASVTASGGTNPYSYIWSPSSQTSTIATGLSAGTYTVTVTDANGCTVTSSTTITQPLLALSASTTTLTNVSCNGGGNGSASVTASGGTNPYSYIWNPSSQTNTIATGLSAGTYTVTVTDANGCIATSSATITQPLLALSASTTTLTNVNCNGNANGSASVTASGGTNPYSYIWNPSSQTNTIATGLSAGTYTVTVTDANGCTVTSSATITQPLLALSASTTTLTNVNCNGNANGSASVTASGGTNPYRYVWNPSGQTNTIATGLSAGTYTVTVTDANGCTVTSSTTITQPLLALSASTTTLTNVNCNGNANGSASVTAIGGTSPYSYIWNPSSQTNAIATGLSAGTYTITVTDAHGCIATSSTTITQPLLALSASTTTLTNVSCNGGGNGSASVVANGGTNPYNYVWIPSGQTNTTATGLSAGTYTIIVADGHGCTASATASITQPLAALSASTSIVTNISCNGNANGSASVIAIGGTSPYSYIWNPSSQTNVTATGLSAGTYTVIVTDAHRCTATSSATITQPLLALSASTAIVANVSCNGGGNGSASVAASGGTSPYRYIWNPSRQTNAMVTGLSAGIYTVTVTDAHGCMATSTVVIVQPLFALAASTTIVTNVNCNGNANGSASVNASGGTPPYNYLWSPSSQTSATAYGLNAQTYTVSVTDANGCTAVKNVTITQPATLSLSVTGYQRPLCKGQPVTIDASTSGGTLPYTYSWSTGSTNSSLTVIPLTTITYTVTVTDANGCSETGTTTITVTPFVVTAGQNGSICAGQSANLIVYSSGGDGQYSYTWLPGNSTTQLITVTPAATVTYTVIVTDGCNATDTVYETVVVNPLPVISFNSDVNVGCAPLCVQFRNSGSGNIAQWTWNFGDGTTESSESPIHCYPNPGRYTVALTATSNLGCSSSTTRESYITVYGNPTAAFVADPQPTTIANPIIQFTNQTKDKDSIISWLWNFGAPGDSNTSNLSDPFHRYSDTGTYKTTLVVVTKHGCVDSVAHDVVIGPAFTLFFPNAFTPNGDGVNDMFFPKGTYVKDFEMYIYDRWGMKLFHTTNINEGWDGKVNGTMAQEDVYVYIASVSDASGNKHQYTGRVTLLK